MWFVYLALTNASVPALTENIAGFRYRTQGECLVAAGNRADALRSIDMHGFYLCSYHNEPVGEIRRAARFSF